MTTAGTRAVSYNAATGTVTYFPGQSGLERSVAYSYTDNRLSGITAQDFSGTVDSVQGFSYTGGALTQVTYPDYYATPSKPNARTEIAYNGASATITTYGTLYDASDSGGLLIEPDHHPELHLEPLGHHGHEDRPQDGLRGPRRPGPTPTRL